MARKVIIVFAVLMMFLGAGVFIYPVFSNLYYEKMEEDRAAYYDNLVREEIPAEEIDSQWEECRKYNETLMNGPAILFDPFDGKQLDPTTLPYAALLNEQGDGTMGHIEIPAIDVDLMIYHGTTEEMLQKGVGHLMGTSLPVGGIGSHCVLSAHTGLGNRRMFTDLDQLVEGDVFYLHILDDTLAYQVDQIKVVEPDDSKYLRIDANEDYVTLVTCTPYGVNSHRLLVRGTRISYEKAKQIEDETSGRPSVWEDEYKEAAVTGVVIVIVMIDLAVLYKQIRKVQKRKGKKK